MQGLFRSKRGYGGALLGLFGLLLICAGCGGGGGGLPSGGGNGAVSGTSIRGRVVDRASSQPIESALVTVGASSTRTVADGTFSLGTSSGTISIAVSANNYNPATFSAVVEPNERADVGDLPLSNIDAGPPPLPL